MKKIIMLAIIGFGVFQAWGKYWPESSVVPIFTEPYVAVYGRDSCSVTQNMLKDLKSSNINYHYFEVDNKSVADKLHKRMSDVGISTRKYNLPVVDVNGQLSVRPKFVKVSNDYETTYNNALK
jgi:hypothetical protein